MVNYNGKIHSKESFFLNHRNRAFRYGDALVEAIRLVDGKLVFWEDHYFRLMASMRMLRMKIPMEFTMEFLESEVNKLCSDSDSVKSQQIRITVFRNQEKKEELNYTGVSYIIEAMDLNAPFFIIDEGDYEVEIFKDFFVAPGLFSSLNRIDKTLPIVANIFADENDYDDCILLNSEKSLVGTVNGSLFLVKGNTIKTPMLTDGAKNSILRNKAIEIFLKWDDLEISEESISPFELQKADELFVLNDIYGVQPVTKYRKKKFNSEISKKLVGRLNALARLG